MTRFTKISLIASERNRSYRPFLSAKSIFVDFLTNKTKICPWNVVPCHGVLLCPHIWACCRRGSLNRGFTVSHCFLL